MADLEADAQTAVETGQLILVFVGIALVAYIGYEVYVLGGSVSNAFTNFFSSVFGGSGNLQSSNANASNYVEPYGSAADSVLTDPVGAIGSILGLNQEGGDVPQVSSEGGG